MQSSQQPGKYQKLKYILKSNVNVNICGDKLLCVFERELNQDLKCLEEQVLTLQAEREIWLRYKNVGRHKDKDQIDHLKDELSGLQKVFEEMAGECF